MQRVRVAPKIVDRNAICGMSDSRRGLIASRSIVTSITCSARSLSRIAGKSQFTNHVTLLRAERYADGRFLVYPGDRSTGSSSMFLPRASRTRVFPNNKCAGRNSLPSNLSIHPRSRGYSLDENSSSRARPHSSSSNDKCCETLSALYVYGGVEVVSSFEHSGRMFPSWKINDWRGGRRGRRRRRRSSFLAASQSSFCFCVSEFTPNPSGTSVSRAILTKPFFLSLLSSTGV